MRRIALDHFTLVLVCAVAAQAIVGAPPTESPAPSAPAKYFQVLRDDEKQPQFLETAVARFVPAEGEPEVSVDLVAAIHVADKEYFETLNTLLATYDVVLYEMIKPKAGETGSKRPVELQAVATMQRVLPTTLGFAFQADEIDYKAKNFVHADMSPAEMSEAMRRRGETGFSVFMKVVQEVLQQSAGELSAGSSAGSASDLSTLFMLTQKDSVIILKRMIADRLDSMGPDLGLGSTLETMLVADRNAAAMDVLRDELKTAEGKPRRIAIFYGAAHMPDFAKRLTDELGMTFESVRWVRAWDIEKEPRASALEGLLQSFGP